MEPLLCKARDLNDNLIYGQPFPTENGIVFIEATTMKPVEIYPDTLQVPLYWQDDKGKELYDKDSVQVDIFQDDRRVWAWGRIKAYGNGYNMVCIRDNEDDKYLLANCEHVELDN